MTTDKLTDKNTVFFSTANNSYIFFSAVSLLSIRRFLPNAKLYILSRNISPSNKRFLEKHHIQYIELDLTYLFFQTWDYPIECYYIFAGPKLFHELGFKYSVYLDGDVLCLKNPLKHCPPINDIGGTRVNTFHELFGQDQPYIIDRFRIKTALFSKHRIQSGVVYMNNEYLSKQYFLERCGELYYNAWQTGHPRKGDDSLFALYQLEQYPKLSPVTLNNSYNYMPHFNDFRKDSSTIFFHFTSDKPWKKAPYTHQDKRQNIYNYYTKQWRKIAIKTDLLKWLQLFPFLNEIKSLPKTIQHSINTFHFILKRVRFSNIRKRANLQKPSINLYWWEPANTKNFGDVVSRDIITNILGRNVLWSPIESCDMIATGSIIEVAKNTKRKTKLYAWGSGFIRSDSNNNGLDNIVFTAVRGKKSMSRIRHKVPLGDPGILINSTYAIKRKRSSCKIGVIIHYIDIKLPITKQFCEDPRFEIITPLDNPENVARKIAQCGLILSSSLHGLIFADSLSIPNAHIKLSDNLTGGTYKFYDYYSGVDKPYHPADVNKIFNDNYLSNLKASYKPIPKLSAKQRALIKAFPFH